MNIFVLDASPSSAAEYMCDKHVVKMVLETAQLLCSIFPNGQAPYKATHFNHPCSKWTRLSSSNYKWLLLHGEALAEEYTLRYGKTHKSEDVIKWCKEQFANNKIVFSRDDLTPFVCCMPDKYKTAESAVINYRNYYSNEKSYFAKWEKGTKKPFWYIK